ncbi:pseudouridine synthase [Limtongia smithiae]|uniref:pseudouridine synthase n=1 Tax=Limtongia smithiae TaxID=1125753 RepID=UPI0034CF4F3F
MSDSEAPPLKRPRLSPSVGLAAEDIVIEAADTSATRGIQESDVGIVGYLGSHEGFRGVLKQRYTDFLVNEILPGGQVLRVEHVPVQPPKEQKQERTTGEDGSEQVTESSKSEPLKIVADQSAVEEIIKFFGAECAEKAALILTPASGTTMYETSISVDDKDERGKIHRFFRAAYGGRIETGTTGQNTFVLKKSSAFSRQQRGEQQNGGRINRKHGNKRFEGGGGPKVDPYVIEHAGKRAMFTHFTIYKENKESMDVCRIISKYLRKTPKSVTIAGTKDRRGVTVQRASVHQVPVDRLVSLNKALRDVVLSDFVYRDDRLKLGDLDGNEFLITIRDVTAASTSSFEELEQRISESLTSLRTSGFINYFGMQRFGTFSISTHTIGTLILQTNYESAVMHLLRPQPLASPDSLEAREQFAAVPDDPGAALKLMPYSCTAECALLRGLQRSSTDYLGALMQIPRNLRLMYVHAYQSYVWNYAVSQRIEKFGLAVLEGDLVLEDTNKIAAQERYGDDEEEFEEEVISSGEYPRARVISADEAANGTITIFDIVMPTPGFDVTYPADPYLLSIYKDIMAQDSLDPYNMRRNVKEFSLAGSYRHVLSKPGDVDWCIRQYDAPLQQMVRTDLDMLQEPGLPRVYTQEEIPPGNKVAVILRLKLGTSQYATMALREVMKLETSRRGDMLEVRVIGNRDGDVVNPAEQIVTTD